jgi:hypothetical protein
VSKYGLHILWSATRYRLMKIEHSGGGDIERLDVKVRFQLIVISQFFGETTVGELSADPFGA